MTSEQKKQNFVRLAEKRVTQTFEVLRKISNLGSPNYVFTKEQIQAMELALLERVQRLFLAFNEKPFVALGVEDFTFEGYTEAKEPAEDGDLDDFEVTEHTDEKV